MAKFLGFKQVSLSTYNGLTENAKKHYLWLVRDVNASGETMSAAIYFGTRLYAQVNEVDSGLTDKVNNILASLGSAIDSNGEFVGFFEAPEILGSSEDFTEAIESLGLAILADRENIESAERRIAAIESGLTSMEERLASVESAISEADAALETKADKATTLAGYGITDAYTKAEVDEKVAGMFHFKGVVDTYEELLEIENPENGDVWQVVEKNSEYAWNGSEWVELGSLIDLTNYYTKDEVNSAITEAVAEEDAELDALKSVVDQLDDTLAAEIEAREDEDDAIKARLTLSADTYDDALALLPSMELGQIVYILTDEAVESGHTAGAYIKTQAGLKKVEATNGDGSDVEDRVEALENKVGNTPLPSGQTITDAIVDLYNDPTHIITGDDVES